MNDFVWDPGLAHAVRDCEEIPPHFLPFSSRRGVVCIGSFGIHRTSTRSGICARRSSRRSTRRFSRSIRSGSSATSRTTPSETSPARSTTCTSWDGCPLCFRTSRGRGSLSSPSGDGAGTKRKLVQALAVGTPSVSTSIGVEGLAVEHEEHVLIADDADAFAAEVERLLTDAELWARLARAGRACVRKTNGRTLTSGGCLKRWMWRSIVRRTGDGLPLRNTPRRWLRSRSCWQVWTRSGRRGAIVGGQSRSSVLGCSGRRSSTSATSRRTCSCAAQICSTLTTTSRGTPMFRIAA